MIYVSKHCLTETIFGVERSGVHFGFQSKHNCLQKINLRPNISSKLCSNLMRLCCARRVFTRLTSASRSSHVTSLMGSLTNSAVLGQQKCQGCRVLPARVFWIWPITIYDTGNGFVRKYCVRAGRVGGHAG
jgi:hypothetical protein